MKLTKLVNFDQVAPKELPRYLTILGDNLKVILNNGISFLDNFNGTVQTITFSLVNTDTLFVHSLGRTPTGYKVIRTSVGMVVYDGANLGRDWTDTTLVLRSTVAGDCTIELF